MGVFERRGLTQGTRHTGKNQIYLLSQCLIRASNRKSVTPSNSTCVTLKKVSPVAATCVSVQLKRPLFATNTQHLP